MFCFMKQPEQFNKLGIADMLEKENGQEERGFFEILKATMKLMFSKKSMFVNPEMIWTGISIAFYSSMFTPIIVF